MMRFSIGEEVIYVGPDFRGAGRLQGIIAPVPLFTYHIRGGRYFDQSMSGPCAPGWAYLLIEIKNEIVNHCGVMMEGGHVNEQFLRPIIRRSQAIEELLKLQNPKKEPANV